MTLTVTDVDLEHANVDSSIARRSRVWRSVDQNPEVFHELQRPKGSIWTIAALASLIGLGAAGFARLDNGPTAEQLPPSLGSLSSVVDQIGARSLWQQGITGAGINVALIDTGVAPVDALSNQIVAAVDLSSEQFDEGTSFLDANGHGTHLAGIIAGKGSSGFRGVAPDAGIVSIKVADREGKVSLESVISGIDWVVASANDLDIRVLNIALDAGEVDTHEAQALEAAVERAWSAGIVVVTAAGNDGVESGSLNSPASNPFVIAVAGVEAIESGFVVPDWASVGTESRRPDLAAPGSHIQSLRAPGSDADTNNPEGYVDEELFLGSGSSQSAAVTAGAVALLLEARPELTPDQVKSLLIQTARPIAAENMFAALDIRGALEAPSINAVQSFSRTHSPAEFATTGVVTLNPEWSGAKWSGAKWSGAKWSGAKWSGAKWSGAKWS